MALDLSVPAERVSPPKDLEIRPKQAKAWLDSLPLAQAVDAARKVRANLGTLSRAKLEVDVRLQLLEVYAPITNTLLEELDALYSKSSLPLAPKAREALGLARDIAAESAHGYKIAILEKTGKLIAFGTKKHLPPMIYRAMRYLSAGILAAYKSYTPIAPGSWKEVHYLYLYAEKEGFLNEAIDTEEKATIGELYAEMLLLSLTDPYRLIQGEVQKTLDLIRGHKGVVTLGRTKPNTPPTGHFLVPCDADRPPKPALTSNDDTGGPNWRLFDANPIVDKLRQRRQALETGNVSATMKNVMGPDGLSLLAKLIALWGDPPKRAQRRDPMDTKVFICAGIRSLSHFVSQEVHLDTSREAEAIKSARTLPLLVLPDDEASRSQMSEWEVVNQSAGGVKVKRTQTTNQSISVGEAVGIWFMGRGHWTIGVVRWITMLEEGGMEFGVQFLAPFARAVAVQPTLTSGGVVKAGLLLLESEAAKDSDSLLTPLNTYSDLREFEIEEDGEVSRIRARNLIEKTGRFELFHFSPS